MHNRWVLFPFLLVFRIAEYVLSVAHGLVLSGTTIAWYVTVVTSSRITYALSVGSATIQTCRKTCYIVICAKGKKAASRCGAPPVPCLCACALLCPPCAPSFVTPVPLFMLSAALSGMTFVFTHPEGERKGMGKRYGQK